MSEAADLDARHGATFGSLADQIAVQQRDDVDGVVESHAEFAAASPGHPARWPLAGGDLNRDTVAQRGGEIAADHRPKRGDLTDFAVLSDARVIDRRWVERPPLVRGRRVLLPRQAISNDEGGD